MKSDFNGKHDIDERTWKPNVPLPVFFTVILVLKPLCFPPFLDAEDRTQRPSRHYVSVDNAPLEKLDLFEKGTVLAQNVLPPPIRVSDVKGITIFELQQLAAQHNPTLKLLHNKIGAARGEWVQAGLKPNPVLALEAEEIGDGGKAGKHGVVLEQEITTGGKRRLDRTVAAWEHDQSRWRREIQGQAIQNDVRARAYEVLAAQRKVEIRSRLAEIGKKSIEAAAELRDAGEVSKIDLLQIRAKANESEAALQAAKSEELVTWKKLVCMIGLQDMQPVPIDDSLEQLDSCLDRDTSWEILRQAAPQLAMARSNVRQTQAVLTRQQAGMKPDVTVSGGIHYDYGERQTLASVGVGVPLQVFDRNQGNIMKARADLAAACRDLERQTLLLYEEFSEVCSTLESSKEQIEIYKSRILPDVQEALELGLKGYRQGEYTYMEVLSAQQLYLEAQTQYIEVLKNHAIAWVYLDGFLARGGLEAGKD